MPSTRHLDHFIINLNGTNFDPDHMDKVLSVEVDHSLYLPSMFALHMNDPDVKDLESDFYKLGGIIKIIVKLGQPPDSQSAPPPTVLMIGEITSIEPDLSSIDRTTITIRGYDRSHKMNRERKTKTYLNVKDSDLAQQLAQASGLTASVDATQLVYPYLMQANQTDWEFISERAKRIGYRLYVEDRTLHFKLPTSSPPVETQLEWGMELGRFRPRMSTVEQVSEVKVYGWDPKKKSKIMGVANSPTNILQNRRDNGKSGGSSASAAHSKSGKESITTYPVLNQSEAEKVAKALLDNREGNFIQAEAEAGGDPNIRAGSAVRIKGVGARFGGKYLVTRAIHRYSQKGYDVRFWCSGGKDNVSMTSLLQTSNGNGKSALPAG